MPVESEPQEGRRPESTISGGNDLALDRQTIGYPQWQELICGDGGFDYLKVLCHTSPSFSSSTIKELENVHFKLYVHKMLNKVFLLAALPGEEKKNERSEAISKARQKC